MRIVTVILIQFTNALCAIFVLTLHVYALLITVCAAVVCLR